MKTKNGVMVLPSCTNSIRMRLQAPTDGRKVYYYCSGCDPRTDDLPNTHVTSTFEPFIFYVWQTEANSRKATLDALETPQIISDEEPKAITVTLSGADSQWARVEFQVYEGSGTLFEDKDGKNGPDNNPSRQLIAFSNNNGNTESSHGVPPSKQGYQQSSGMGLRQ